MGSHWSIVLHLHLCDPYRTSLPFPLPFLCTDASSDQLRADIVDLKEQLKLAQEKRRQKMEYDELAKKILAIGKRFDLERYGTLVLCMRNRDGVLPVCAMAERH